MAPKVEECTPRRRAGGSEEDHHLNWERTARRQSTACSGHNLISNKRPKPEAEDDDLTSPTFSGKSSGASTATANSGGDLRPLPGSASGSVNKWSAFASSRAVSMLRRLLQRQPLWIFSAASSIVSIGGFHESQSSSRSSLRTRLLDLEGLLVLRLQLLQAPALHPGTDAGLPEMRL